VETLKKYRVLVDLQDRQGYKWGQGCSLWAYSLESASRGGKLYMEWLNARDNGEIATGYRAYEMGVAQ